MNTRNNNEIQQLHDWLEYVTLAAGCWLPDRPPPVDYAYYVTLIIY